jgi:hypothetical protein
MEEVARITGHRPTLDDFLSGEATDRLMRRYLAAAGASGVQRRAWTTDLEGDARAALVSVAAALAGTTAYWLHRLCGDAGAVRVAAGPLIRHAGHTFAAGDYDLVLVSDDADDGLRFAWDHLPNGDEYELVCWGAYRMP